MNRRRVVVLARAGGARDRTEVAVREAGADVAASLDPLTTSIDDVRAVAPDALVVVLDPVAETALGKFDDLLADPALEVMFDDADVAARRDGWEAARWARHMAAKLYGHGDVLPAVPERAGRHDFNAEMQELTLQVASMPQVPQAPAHPPRQREGAVVVVAGIGGPDAVRQLLVALPANFPRPVLLRQKIEGGQYDKLVRQMQRATTMQVVLAQAGEPLQQGAVHVLPDGLDVGETPAGLVFIETAAEPRFAALPAGDSAMLLLSGADPGMLDVAMTLRWGGGLVYGQAPENCFDPAASKALVARGGESRSLAVMGLQLLERWHA